MVAQTWSSHGLCYLFFHYFFQYYPVERITKQKIPNISPFMRMPKVYNKYKANLELQPFYSLIKQITHFKVIKNKKLKTLFI